MNGKMLPTAADLRSALPALRRAARGARRLQRVGIPRGCLSGARGARRAMVRNAVGCLPQRLTIGDLRRVCGGINYPTLQRARADMRREKLLRCLGRGPDAQWERNAG